MSRNRRSPRRKPGAPRDGEVAKPGRISFLKKFLIGGVVTVALGTGVYHLLAPREEPQPAPVTLTIGRVAHPERQSFLDDLVTYTDIPFCAGIVYDHSGDKIIAYVRNDMRSMGTDKKLIDSLVREYEERYAGGDYRAKTPTILDLSGQDRHTKIFVGRNFFEEYTHYTDEDMRCTLVAHEGRHVYQHAKGMEHLKKETIVQAFNDGRLHHIFLYELNELDANYHELKRIQTGEFKVSPAYRKDVRETYDENLMKLRLVTNRGDPLMQRLVKHYLDKVKDLP